MNKHVASEHEGVNREDFYAQFVIKHSVLKATWKNMKGNFVKADPSR
jgi:hypothetical protein